jgi:two-component system response regulator BaeR
MAGMKLQGMRVAIVEDEPKLAAVLRDYLIYEGAAADIYGDGTLALDALTHSMPDLVLLDLMLPGLDGLSLCRKLREFSTVPIVMLTARVEEIDRLLGLDIGADDYLCKPCSPREVLARVHAQWRRKRWSSGPETGPADRLELDDERFEVRLAGQRLDLTPVEFRLLRTLRSKPGRVYSRAQLLEHLYLDHRVVSDRTVDSHIKNLRRKFDELGQGADPIVSVYGVGYKYEPRD